MNFQRYPDGTVRALLESELVTFQTREALLARLDEGNTSAPNFLTDRQFSTLKAAARRLISQPDDQPYVELAGLIDSRLASGSGDGWRYDDMPPDGEAYSLGLQALDDSALSLFGAAFSELDGASQDRTLSAVQAGEIDGAVWETVPATRFFEELLAELAELYYSHPLAQEMIGYVGMADARGWRAIGLNERESWEPKELDEESAEP